MVYFGHFVGFVVKKNAANVSPILIQGFALIKISIGEKVKTTCCYIFSYLWYVLQSWYNVDGTKNHFQVHCVQDPNV